MINKSTIKNTRWVHVAGTNGKGSTCAYIACGLIGAGYKVGKFTSPHIFDVTERITVNDTPIPRECIPELPEGRWFQTLWEVALRYFAEQSVDYAVIETGIGGLHDCTNKLALPDYNGQLFITTARGHRLDLNSIFKPAISVITKIGYDHMDLLGNTITQIATHKAGIIKAGVPVVTDPTQFDEAMTVIRETAESKGSRLFIPDSKSDNIFEQNKIVAREALRVLGINSCDFSRVKLRARMEKVHDNPEIIVDGAHNYDAIKAVLQMVDVNVVVFGMLKSKDYASCIKLLDGYELILVDDVECPEQVKSALGKARSRGENTLVCGSLYLAANVLKLF
jgi:dihydrofolate synthase/folylpolyglutamate synthase